MTAHLMTLIQTTADTMHRKNIAREYLQALILSCLQQIGAMVALGFHGGTALRFLYNIPRYSEDLDFTLERPDNYDFRAYLQMIQTELSKEGYIIELKVNDKKTVHSAFVRFKGLLYQLGLSPHQNELLAVKIEVDTNPPAGTGLATTVVRRHLLLQLQHHNQASLLAGKLHAVLQRPYTKGRDIYDLMWYLSDPHWPSPNLSLLNNALQQTGWSGVKLTEHNWRNVVTNQLQTIDWNQIAIDVQPFLEKQHEVDFLTYQNLLRLLRDQN